MEQQHFKMGWLAKALVEAMTLISQEAPSFGFPVHFETGKLDYFKCERCRMMAMIEVWIEHVTQHLHTSRLLNCSQNHICNPGPQMYGHLHSKLDQIGPQY